MPATFDDFERRILAALQEDGRLSVQDLSTRIGLSTSPTWRRVKALEETGVIERYVALVNPVSAGLPACVFAFVTLVKHEHTTTESFEHSVKHRPEVLECHSMMGDADYVLKIRVPDVGAYEKFVQEVIYSNSSVQHIRSSMALRTVKYTSVLPV